MREQVRLKLDDLLDRYDKITVQLTVEEQIEFRRTLIEEIE